MKWPFSRRQPEPEKRALTYDDFPMELLSPATSAGINVSPELALRSPTVLAAVRAIYETVGTLPIVVRSKTGEVWERDRDHPAAKILSGFANEYTVCTDLRMQLQLDMLLHGAGFAQVVRVRGEVKELIRLNPRAVSVEYDEDSGEPRYRVSLHRQSVILPWQEVLHIGTPGSAPDRRMCLIDLCRESIALDILLARHVSKTFKDGGLPRIILSPSGGDFDAKNGPTILANALKFLKEQLDAEGSDPILLPSNFSESFKSFGFREMQVAELRRLIIEDIARGLRVPAPIVGDTTKSTYNNVSTLSQNFLMYSLLPHLEVWEAALTRALLKPEERDRVEVEFETRDLLRGDFAAQATAYRTATGGAWLTVNEVRELEGRPPHPDGDKLILQAGQADAGESGNEPSNDNNPPKEPEEPEEDA